MKVPDYLLERIFAEAHNISLRKDDDHGGSVVKTNPAIVADQFCFGR
jgi:hypothetical protein